MSSKKYLILSLAALFIVLLGLFLIFKPLKNELDLNLSELNATSMSSSNAQTEPQDSKGAIKGLFADFNQSAVSKNLQISSQDLMKSPKTAAQDKKDMNLTLAPPLSAKTEANFTANLPLNSKINSNENLDANTSGQGFEIAPKINLDENTSSNLNLSSNTQNYETLEQNSSTLSAQTPFKLEMKEPSNPKARLAIIIDDVASSAQTRQIKALGMKITPSFFPADKNHPNTPRLAREFDFFMLHLPLEAKHFKDEELKTLRANDSFEEIDKYLSRIKRDFKGLIFINNHTGSAFTSDLEAMRRLIRGFEKHGFVFVDSLTAGSSKGAKVLRERGYTPIVRDIFLDNEDNVEAIKKQLVKAVNLARKKGFAIAIGHPRKNTFKALAQSKELLQSVQLVYLSEVFAKRNFNESGTQ